MLPLSRGRNLPRLCHNERVASVREFDQLRALVDGRRLVALVGAGLSTDSGIPDYRGAGRPPRTPLVHRDFLASAATRRRYWARSFLGWPRVSAAPPNDGAPRRRRARARRPPRRRHHPERRRAAPARRQPPRRRAPRRARPRALPRLRRGREPRRRRRSASPRSTPAGAAAPPPSRPTATPTLDAAALAGFVVADCLACGGILKPDVVFFGDNVARPVLDEAWRLFDEAELLLVLGSSLTVWSGYRFVRRAAERGLPVAHRQPRPDARRRARHRAPRRAARHRAARARGRAHLGACWRNTPTAAVGATPPRHPRYGVLRQHAPGAGIRFRETLPADSPGRA